MLFLELLPFQGRFCRSPIEVRESGRVMVEQPENAPLPIEVRESGSVIEVKLEQSENARSSIEVREEGRVIEAKL